MSEITIKGDPKQIYNIVKEQRIRIKRGMVEVTGDTGNPKKKEVEVTMVNPKRKKKEKKKEKNGYKTKEEKKTPDNK